MDVSLKLSCIYVQSGFPNHFLEGIDALLLKMKNNNRDREQGIDGK